MKLEHCDTCRDLISEAYAFTKDGEAHCDKCQAIFYEAEQSAIKKCDGKLTVLQRNAEGLYNICERMADGQHREKLIKFIGSCGIELIDEMSKEIKAKNEN